MKAGWQTKKLGEICDIERGGSPRPIQNFITADPNGINWIKIGDATAIGKYIYKTEEKIKPEGIKRSRMVYEGDFTLSNSMSFGRPYIMKTTGCIHDGWLVLHQPKDYFTIYDFVKAHHHFNDPQWDGEPIEPEPTEPRRPKADPSDERNRVREPTAPEYVRPAKIKVNSPTARPAPFNT